MTAIDRDEAAAADDFESFYRDQLDRLGGLAYLLTGDACAVEDLVQETLSRVEPRFEHIAAPEAYARTVLVNLARKQGSNDARRRAAEGAAATPEKSALDDDRLFDVIEALPFRQRAVIVLRYFDDLTERDIAQVLGCRPGTVKSLAARALERLRQEIEL